MQKRLEKESDLAIDPDTVRFFILKAKAISAAVNEDYADGSEHEVELDGQSRDSHLHDGLAEEAEENLTEEELRELINDLNVDEAAELIALAWIGRGDYEAARRYASRQLERDPWREEAHRQVMRVLELSGERSAALAQD